MAYFTKEIYERKREYASKKMMENAKVASLKDKQHDALAILCQIRHEIHTTDRLKLFNCEGCEHNKMIKYFQEIDNGLLESVGLPTLNTIDYTYIPDSYDFYYILKESERSEYDNDFNTWLENGNEFIEFCETIETFNNDVERYLRLIDDEFGTSYCPTGMTRI